MDFNVVLWGNRLRAVSARPYKALDKSLFAAIPQSSMMIPKNSSADATWAAEELLF